MGIFVIQLSTVFSRQKDLTNGWPNFLRKELEKTAKRFCPWEVVIRKLGPLLWGLVFHLSFSCPISFIARWFPKPQVTSHSQQLCECIYYGAQFYFKFNEETRKKNALSHPRLFSSYKWMPGFPGNQMAALCFKISKPLGRVRWRQTEQEAVLPAPSPASLHDWRAC